MVCTVQPSNKLHIFEIIPMHCVSKVCYIKGCTLCTSMPVVKKVDPMAKTRMLGVILLAKFAIFIEDIECKRNFRFTKCDLKCITIQCYHSW